MIELDRETAINAEAGCIQYARLLRKQAKLRRNGGAHNKNHRAWLREAADAQEAAAKEIRRQLDASF